MVLLAKVRRREKTHSVEKEKGRRNISKSCTISIYRYDVANLSPENPTILTSHHTRIISKHTIKSLPAS